MGDRAGFPAGLSGIIQKLRGIANDERVRFCIFTALVSKVLGSAVFEGYWMKVRTEPVDFQYGEVCGLMRGKTYSF